MAFRVKNETYQEALAMFKDGKTYDDIAKATGLTKKSCYLAIGLARKKGDLPPSGRGKPADPVKRFNGIARRAGAPIGLLGVTLGREVNENIMREIAELTAREGYGSVSEYAADLLVEEVFRKKRQVGQVA